MKTDFFAQSLSIHEQLRGKISTAQKLPLETREDLATVYTPGVARDPIILAMPNATPEIFPEEAKRGGAAIVGTGRSDFPNQVNNVLAFPGIFRGALDAAAARITPEMKMAAAHALANVVNEPTSEKILPDPMSRCVAPVIAEAVAAAAP